MSILGAQLSSSLYPRRQCLVFGPWPPDPWPPDLWPPDPTVSKCAEVLIKRGEGSIMLVLLPLNSGTVLNQDTFVMHLYYLGI